MGHRCRPFDELRVAKRKARPPFDKLRVTLITTFVTLSSSKGDQVVVTLSSSKGDSGTAIEPRHPSL